MAFISCVCNSAHMLCLFAMLCVFIVDDCGRRRRHIISYYCLCLANFQIRHFFLPICLLLLFLLLFRFISLFARHFAHISHIVRHIAHRIQQQHTRHSTIANIQLTESECHIHMCGVFGWKSGNMYVYSQKWQEKRKHSWN